MAEYQITLEREATEEGYVTVDAESSVEAQLKAELLNPDEIRWDRVNSGKHWATVVEKEEKS